VYVTSGFGLSSESTSFHHNQRINNTISKSVLYRLGCFVFNTYYFINHLENYIYVIIHINLD